MGYQSPEIFPNPILIEKDISMKETEGAVLRRLPTTKEKGVPLDLEAMNGVLTKSIKKMTVSSRIEIAKNIRTMTSQREKSDPKVWSRRLGILQEKNYRTEKKNQEVVSLPKRGANQAVEEILQKSSEDPEQKVLHVTIEKKSRRNRSKLKNHKKTSYGLKKIKIKSRKRKSLRRNLMLRRRLMNTTNLRVAGKDVEIALKFQNPPLRGNDMALKAQKMMMLDTIKNEKAIIIKSLTKAVMNLINHQAKNLEPGKRAHKI